jgi:large subunit ribosomal protein L21
LDINLILYFCSPKQNDLIKYRFQMYAIVDVAGQQFKVEEGQKIFVHRLSGKEGETVDIDQVLLIDQGDKILVGDPLVAGALVTAKVLDHPRGDKVKVFKKKRRKGYQVLKGHRQDLTQLLIESINEKAPARKAASPKKKEEEAPSKKPASAKAAGAKTPAKETTTKKATPKAPASKKPASGTKPSAPAKKTVTTKSAGPAKDAQKSAPKKPGTAGKGTSKSAGTKKASAKGSTAKKVSGQKSTSKGETKKKSTDKN